MDAIEQFIAMVDNLSRRPSMYCKGGTYNEFVAYVNGYTHGSPDCPLSGKGYGAFCEFICITYHVPAKLVWDSILEKCRLNDHERIELAGNLLISFAQQTRTQSTVQILEDARRHASSYQEEAPEKTWRALYLAILRSNRTEIEPLIENHPDARVLWQGAYPPDEAESLEYISEDNVVFRLPEISDAENVFILTIEFGPVRVKHANGRWQVDVGTIIECLKQKLQPTERAIPTPN